MSDGAGERDRDGRLRFSRPLRSLAPDLRERLPARRRRPPLGQHFLADSGYRRRIVEALDLTASDFVVEVGAGRGAMTELLAERVSRLVAIELDPRLARELEAKFEGRPHVKVLQADILSCDFSALCKENQAERCFVFGNLPYYITSPILHHLFRSSRLIRAMGLLVQREVGSRLAASPGSRAYGYLSVLAQWFSRLRIPLIVPPGAFLPAPRISSALVVFEIRAIIEEWKIDEVKFLDFVKRSFLHKRKNLLNNLSAPHSRARVEGELARLGLPASIRAEQLSIPQLTELFRALE